MLLAGCDRRYLGPAPPKFWVEAQWVIQAAGHRRRLSLLSEYFGVVLGAIVSGGFNYLSHQGDLDAKMIELGVAILRAEPTPETAPLREWAIDVIDKKAKFSFNEEQRSALLKKQLPFLDAWSWPLEKTVLRSGIDDQIVKKPSPA
jgi:hypothetical protein